MPSPSYGKFGPLLGVIYVSNSHCRFLIYSTSNAEVLAFHEIKLRQIIHHAGWLEYEPLEIWKQIQECIEAAYKSLVILEIPPQDIIAVGICNQRGTTVLWDKETGLPLHNAIGWTDCRSYVQLKQLLQRTRRNVDYTRCLSGLPLSTCFSALKVMWLMETVPAVSCAIEAGNCLFGTLDSWILWNLTGGTESGVHSTDVTNAGFTGLMNVKTLNWDQQLCNFFRIPMSILPTIKSNSEIYGFIIDGPLSGLPISGCIGDQSAALIGQLQVNVGQKICTVDESCFVVMNTGGKLFDSCSGLLSTVGYKLGPTAATCYVLEGAISNSGSSVNWLKEKLNVNTEVRSNDNVVEALTTFLGENSIMSSSCSSSILNTDCGLAAKRSEITFVPAFHGLYSPYWRYDTRGILLGLNSQTTAENVTQSAYEATGFQIYEVLKAFKTDTLWEWSKINDRLIIGGDFAENNSFLQFIADIVGCLLERPQTISPAGLGAMIVAGITMNVVSLLHAELRYMPPSDPFLPTTTQNRRELLYKRWDYAVKKCLNWNNYETYESDMELFAQRECDTNFYIKTSIPGSIFFTSSFALLLLAKYLQK